MIDPTSSFSPEHRSVSAGSSTASPWDQFRHLRHRSARVTALSLSQTTTYHWSFAEDVLGCERAGIRRLGVWRRKLEDFGLDRAVELLRDHPVGISSLSWGGGFTGGNGMSFDEAVDDTRIAIEQASRIGAHALTIVSGGRAGHITSHARRLLMEGLAATLDVAAKHGVTIALQPMAPVYVDEWTFLDTFSETLAIVRDFAHPFLGIAFGTYHLWQEPGLLEQIHEAAPDIATVQLSDAQPPHSDCNRLVPGEGVIPLQEIVGGLISAGYRGDFEVDLWSSSLWMSDYDDLLEKCVAGCSAMIDSAGHPPSASSKSPSRSA